MARDYCHFLCNKMPCFSPGCTGYEAEKKVQLVGKTLPICPGLGRGYRKNLKSLGGAFKTDVRHRTSDIRHRILTYDVVTNIQYRTSDTISYINIRYRM